MTDGIIITNPPYGQRIGEEASIARIYESFRRYMKENPGWSLFVITTEKETEERIGREADRRRKLYNGRLETCYYQFHGKRK